jgi:predicted aspartyl protease
VIRGNVEEGVPLIKLKVADQDFTAIVDTGFNGDVELPLSLKPLLSSMYIGKTTSYLAGGQSIVEDTYLLKLPFDGREIEVEATFVADKYVLIGTSLLKQHRLEVNFLERSVAIERA